MMKDSFFSIMGVLLLFLLGGCDKNFSVNAQYEDFPIVLGLINEGDNTHYVKVYKSFITENNAYDAAKDIHLYSYIDSVEVYMEERDAKETLVRKILFDTTTEIPKDPGIFAYPTQIIYKANADLNPNYSYQLFVYNRYTKKMAYSQPVLLAGQVTLKRPSTTSSTIGITYSKFEVEFLQAKNTHLYEFLITYYYSETMNDNTVRQGKPIEWNLGQHVGQLNVSGYVVHPATGAAFFQKIANNITEDADVFSRHTDSIVLSVFSAGKDWYLYLKANKPSSGINQNRLDYSNISAYNTENNEEKYALGLFSSRATTRRMYRDLSFPNSRDSLFYGMYTGHLKFTDIY